MTTRPMIVCRECGKRKPHNAHGLCRKCYDRQFEIMKPRPFEPTTAYRHLLSDETRKRLEKLEKR